MPRKMGGLVCDNDACRKFCDYADQETLRKWIVKAKNITEPGDPDSVITTEVYCSKECAEKKESGDE